MPDQRRIHKSGDEPFVLRLLQNIFTAELIHPSNSLYLLSAWVTNFRLLDNRTGMFDTLVPHWGRTEIRLSEVLVQLAEQGTQIYIAVRHSDINAPFLQTMKESEALLPPGRILYQKRPRFHGKGLLGEDYLLSGSFNFTNSGIRIENDEGGFFTVNSQTVADERVHAAEEWNANAEYAY